MFKQSPNAEPLKTTIIADSVLSPSVVYGEKETAVKFVTEEDIKCKIIFDKLDSIKISRGEYMPFEYVFETGSWIYKVKKSKWLKNRHSYESKHYGSNYEFGGNVDEMLTDFSHYLISFHDEFIEVIARGIWIKTLEDKSPYPFLKISNPKSEKLNIQGIDCVFYSTAKSLEKVVEETALCSQIIWDINIELDEKMSSSHKVRALYSGGKLIYQLEGYFGKPIKQFETMPIIDDLKPFIAHYLSEVIERRKVMGK